MRKIKIRKFSIFSWNLFGLYNTSKVFKRIITANYKIFNQIQHVSRASRFLNKRMNVRVNIAC